MGKQIITTTLEHRSAFPAIIICPACVKINWQREVIKWLPGRSVEVMSGFSGPAPTADIVILNYDIVAKRLGQLQAFKPRAIILDESHYVKNHKAKRTDAVRKLGKDVQVKLCLTGTPV